MTKWKPMSPINHGDLSTTEQWNEFVTNINLLQSPNKAWARATGNESAVIWTVAPGAETFRIPHVTVNLNWGGGPLLAVWNYQFSLISSHHGHMAVRIRNSYNDETVVLGHYGRDGAYERAASGMNFLTYSNVPSSPTLTEFWFEAFSPTGQTGVSYGFQFTSRPGLLIVELA